jgi:hypothetical protein
MCKVNLRKNSISKYEWSEKKCRLNKRKYECRNVMRIASPEWLFERNRSLEICSSIRWYDVYFGRQYSITCFLAYTVINEKGGSELECRRTLDEASSISKLKYKVIQWIYLSFNYFNIILFYKQINRCKIWDFHGGDYWEWRLLGCYAVWLL